MYMKALSVTQITEYIKRIFNVDPILSSISVKGEISNFKHHYSGHMYFTLKDDTARIKCVMFKGACQNLKFYPEEGMSVIVTGSVSLYERDGQYQLYAVDMVPDGKGALYVAFEQLKRKLEQEGLFDISRKKTVPKYPSKIGVVTSATGAAIKDIINIATRRYPGVHIMIVPVLVQGNEAPDEIAKAIKLLNLRDDIDVIITGRGGGSIEELWAFNEEIVARAIYNSRIPVISAVGHETDYTIADFVSDLRAPTPSAAAELSVPDKKEIYYKLDICRKSVCNLILLTIKNKRSALVHKKNMLGPLNPITLVNQRKQYIDTLYYKLESLMKNKLNMKKEEIKKCSTNLDSLSPLSIISRGFSVAYKGDRKIIIDDVKKVDCGDNIDILVKNGTIYCKVEGIKEGGFIDDKNR